MAPGLGLWVMTLDLHWSCGFGTGLKSTVCIQPLGRIAPETWPVMATQFQLVAHTRRSEAVQVTQPQRDRNVLGHGHSVGKGLWHTPSGLGALEGFRESGGLSTAQGRWGGHKPNKCNNRAYR